MGDLNAERFKLGRNWGLHGGVRRLEMTRGMQPEAVTRKHWGTVVPLYVLCILLWLPGAHTWVSVSTADGKSVTIEKHVVIGHPSPALKSAISDLYVTGSATIGSDIRNVTLHGEMIMREGKVKDPLIKDNSYVFVPHSRKFHLMTGGAKGSARHDLVTMEVAPKLSEWEQLSGKWSQNSSLTIKGSAAGSAVLALNTMTPTGLEGYYMTAEHDPDWNSTFSIKRKQNGMEFVRTGIFCHAMGSVGASVYLDIRASAGENNSIALGSPTFKYAWRNQGDSGGLKLTQSTPSYGVRYRSGAYVGGEFEKDRL